MRYSSSSSWRLRSDYLRMRTIKYFRVLTEINHFFRVLIKIKLLMNKLIYGLWSKVSFCRRSTCVESVQFNGLSTVQELVLLTSPIHLLATDTCTAKE